MCNSSACRLPACAAAPLADSFALAGYFGPQIMRSVYNGSGAYQNAFLIACGLGAAGIALTAIYRMTGKQRIPYAFL